MLPKHRIPGEDPTADIAPSSIPQFLSRLYISLQFEGARSEWTS
jgi:hypothetical protein